MRVKVSDEVILSAKKFLRTIDAGVLSTMTEIEDEMYPFGSMCPYAFSLKGEIIILISDIARHTKNIIKNNKVAFTVYSSGADYKQASSRISISGDAKMITKDSENYEMVSSRYLKFFPEAKSYFGMHDFNFFTIKPKLVHYVQTFGKIFTFDGNLLVDTLPEWVGHESGVLEHMNNDHSDTFPKYLANEEIEFDGDTSKLKLVEFDQYGFHLTAGKGKCFYMNFPEAAITVNDLRVQFTKLARS